MKFHKKSILTSGLAATLAAAMLVGGGTFAYLQSSTGDVVNQFDANKVMVSLAETTGSEYHIIPGTSQEKDPAVTVDNTVDAYVYVEVNDATDGLVTYSIADGWTLLDGYDNVYYREVAADAADKAFDVLKDNIVSYSADLENSDMLDGEGNLKDGMELTFQAYAIQKDGFADAAAAWRQIPLIVETPEDLQAALSSAESGATIQLGGDITLEDRNVYIGGQDYSDVTLDLGGHTLDAPSFVVQNGEWSPVNIDITVKNGTFRGDGSTGSYPVDVYGDSNCPTNVRFENVTIIAEEGADRAVNVQNNGAGVTFDNCTVTGSVWITDAHAEFDGGTYTAREQDSVCVFSNQSATVNGGTFTAEGSNQKLFSVSYSGPHKFVINDGTFVYGADYAIYTGRTSPASFVEINGGTFNGDAYSGTLSDVAVRE